MWHLRWILVLGFAWFLAVAIELSRAGLLGAIAGVLMNFDVPNIRESVHEPLTIMETVRLPGGVLRIAIGW